MIEYTYGLHEALVFEEPWHDAQVKLLAQAKKYEKVNHGKDNKVHLLTGLLKCWVCGAGMYGNRSVRRKADLDNRLYEIYDKVGDTESLLIEARAKKEDNRSRETDCRSSREKWK